MYFDPTGHYAQTSQGIQSEIDRLRETGTHNAGLWSQINALEAEKERLIKQEYPGRPPNNPAENAMINAGVGGDTFKFPPMVYVSPAITTEVKETEVIIVSGSEYQSDIQAGTDVENIDKPTYIPFDLGGDSKYIWYYFLYPLIHEYSGPIDSHSRFKYNFIEPAIYEIRNAQAEGTENISWLISSSGYSANDIENFTRTANDYGVNLVLFSTADELINYINTGDISKEGGERNRMIDSFSVFAHGAPGALWIGMNQENEGDLEVLLSDIDQIVPEAFTAASNTYFYSCGSATGDENSSYMNFAQEWHERTGSVTVGFDGRTNYLPVNYDENSDAISAARKETGYDQNGAFLYPYEGDNYDKTGSTVRVEYR